SDRGFPESGDARRTLKPVVPGDGHLPYIGMLVERAPLEAPRPNAVARPAWEIPTLVALIGAAAAIRFWNQPLQFHLHADDASHLRLGVDFAESGVFPFTEGRPGYALILGTLIRLIGFHPTDGMILSTICSVITIALTWWWGRASFGPTA